MNICVDCVVYYDRVTTKPLLTPMSAPSVPKLENGNLLLLETSSGPMLLLAFPGEEEEETFVRPILTASELHRTCFYERMEIFSILKSDLVFNDIKEATRVKNLSEPLFVAEAILLSDLLEREKLGKEKYTIVGKLRGDKSEYPLPRSSTTSDCGSDYLKDTCLLS